MPAPLSDEQRAAVLETARRPGATRNAVARQVGVSPSTVSRICADDGIDFDRTQTEIAVRARIVDLKAARVGLATDLLDDVAVARGRMHAAEDARSFSDMAKSVHYLASTHVRLIAVDKDDSSGTEAAKSMLGQLAVALGVKAAEGEGAGDGEA